MFGIRANALIMYIAMSFVLCEKGKTESASYTQFGCNFENNEYKLDTNIPIWNEEGTPADLEFTDTDSLLSFQKLVGQAMANVMEKNPLNNVEQFIRFIQAYKNQTDIKNKKSLEEFFNDYHVPFQPLEDPVSFLMEINTELTKLYPNATDRMYIVSAYFDPPEKIVRDALNYGNRSALSNMFHVFDRLKDALQQFQFQKHVAGIIKVKLITTNITTTTTNNGIIIVDPGYISGSEPFVNPYSVLYVEKSHAELLYPTATPYQMGSVDRSKSTQMENKFALVSITSSAQKPHQVLYLKHKPFCSFMDSTTKGNLLSPYHRIMSYYQDGSLRGYLEFEVLPEYILEVTSPINSRPKFLLSFFNETTGTTASLSVAFHSITPDKISAKTKYTIKDYTNYLSLKPDYNLLDKLQTIQSQVFEDPDLVKDIYELNIRLNEKNNGQIKEPISSPKSSSRDSIPSLSSSSATGTGASKDTSEITSGVKRNLGPRASWRKPWSITVGRT